MVKYSAPSISMESSTRPTSLGSRGSATTNSSQSQSNTSHQSIRSARAIKVFGDLVDENSLSYSPSPFVHKKRLMDITNVSESSIVRELPFTGKDGRKDNDGDIVKQEKQVQSHNVSKDLTTATDGSIVTDITTTSRASKSKGSTRREKSGDKTDIESIDVSAITTEDKVQDKDSQGPSPFESIPLELTPQKPTMEKQQEHDGDVSKDETSQPNSKNPSSNQPPKEIVITTSSKRVRMKSPKGRKRNLSIAKRKALQTKHRLSGSCKKRRAMMRHAQGVLHQATRSVNQGINASREAKDMHTKFVSKQVANLRHEWKNEKDDAIAFYSEAESTKQHILRLRRDIASENARSKAENEHCVKQQRLFEVSKEIEFKSLVHVDHQKKMKEEADNRRRMSTALKARLRKDRKANTERIHLQKIEEEHESHLMRMGDAQDVEEYKKQCAKERRDSYAFRNAEGFRQRQEEAERKAEEQSKQHERHEMRMGDAQDVEEYKKQCAKDRRESYAFRNAEGLRQRQEEEERKAEDRFQEHERLEHKWAGEDDAKEYLKRCQQQRRDSFAYRNLEGRKQRLEEAERKADEKAAEHERLEHKWAGEDDAKEYLKQCEQERRDSYAFRNAEAKRQREEEAERQAEEKFIEHERLKLKWAGEDDAKEYIKRCEQARRESFAFRGRECVRHRAVMAELHSISKEQEHEAYMLKWAAQDDVKKYMADEKEKRRQSFAFRNQEGRRHRELEEKWKYEELEKAHEREVLKSECQKDVEEYKKKCAARDRASLNFRGKELQIQKLRIQEHNEKEYEIDQKRRALETAARGDVEVYVQSCKERRRLSLAFRANEHRRHQEWKRQQKEEERQIRSKHTRKMALDRRYAELAKQKERARNALDAIRHVNCSFSSNPFASILE